MKFGPPYTGRLPPRSAYPFCVEIEEATECLGQVKQGLFGKLKAAAESDTPESRMVAVMEVETGIKNCKAKIARAKRVIDASK